MRPRLVAYRRAREEFRPETLVQMAEVVPSKQVPTDLGAAPRSSVIGFLRRVAARPLDSAGPSKVDADELSRARSHFKGKRTEPPASIHACPCVDAFSAEESSVGAENLALRRR